MIHIYIYFRRTTSPPHDHSTTSPSCVIVASSPEIRPARLHRHRLPEISELSLSLSSSFFLTKLGPARAVVVIFPDPMYTSGVRCSCRSTTTFASSSSTSLSHRNLRLFHTNPRRSETSAPNLISPLQHKRLRLIYFSLSPLSVLFCNKHKQIQLELKQP